MGTRRFKLKDIIEIVVVSMCFFLLFYGIQYTDDMNGYMVEYEEKVTEMGSDFGFVILENLCRANNVDFYDFYHIAIAIQLILFCWVFKRYGVNMIFAMICVLLTSYVQMANQIRYFIAFPLFLLSVYYFFIAKKNILAVILALLSISFHLGIIALYTFFPIYYFFERKKIAIKKQISLYFIAGLVVLILFQSFFSFVVQTNAHFSEYGKEASSILGNLFAVLFSTACLLFIHFSSRSLCINDDDKLMKMIYSLSFFPIIFIIASFSGLQIVIARYVNVFISAWVILILLTKKKYSYRFYYSLLFIVIAFLTRHVLNELFFGTSDIEKIILIWASKNLSI